MWSLVWFLGVEVLCLGMDFRGDEMSLCVIDRDPNQSTGVNVAIFVYQSTDRRQKPRTLMSFSPEPLE